MNIVQRHGLLCPVADLQQLPQAVGDKRKVDAVEDVRRVLPIPAQIAGGNAEIVGLPILRQHLQREAVVDVLHHPVDGAGQPILVVQIPQMAEMPLILIATQGVLDVAGDGGVHIFVGAFLAGKGGGFVVVDAAETHGAAVADILVDAMDAENGFKLAVRDECGVQQNAAVVKLLVLGKEEAQRVRAGEHDLHTAGREHIRKQRRALDEIPHYTLKIKGIMGYNMLLQTLQGKSILAHFSCPYALVVFKLHTIYRKNYCFIDRFCCRSLTAPYRCTFFLR